MADSTVSQRVRFLRGIIPTEARRRTARGLLRVARALADLRRQADQLQSLARSDEDRQAIADLVTEIQERIATLTRGTCLAAEVRRQRDARTRRRRDPWAGEPGWHDGPIR
jgi:hypothetical protein